jgi:ABC-type polysaccharide transport system permease subunit
VYKQGIQKSEMSFGACVGLLQTAINLTLLCTVNWITNVLTDNEMGMF